MDAEIRKGPRACTTCARAKARCIPGPAGSGKCERCDRLRKPCGSQTPAPPRAKKEPRPTKVAELEKRLDQLTSQLHASQAGSGGSTAPVSVAGSPPAISGPLAERSRECERERERERERTRENDRIPGRRGHCPAGQKFGFSHLFPLDAPEPLTLTPACSPSSETITDSQTTNPTPSTSGTTPTPHHPSISSSSASTPQDSMQIWPATEEATAMLSNYRETKLKLLPFVAIPPAMGEGQLRVKRPFLWKAVMMAESFLDGRRQMAMGAELLEEIGVAALRKPRKSLDLVHGIQMLVSWLHYDLNGFQLTNLLFLCRSLCIVLGNTKDPGVYDSNTLEYMRAFAGCFYLNTIVFATNKRQDVFMSTTFLDVCVKAIELTMEYPTDEILLYLIKIQKLAQSISFTLDVDNGNLRNMQLPLAMVVQSFQEQLDGLRAELPVEYLDNPALNAHFSIAEVLLYETAIPDTCLTSLTPTDRLSHLWSCLQSAKAFQTNRFCQASQDLEYPRFICLSAHDFVYTCQVSLKLTSLKAPGWDLALVRKELDLVDLMDIQIEHMVLVVERRTEGRFSRRVGVGAGGRGTRACWAVGGQEVEPLERILISLRGFKEALRQESEKAERAEMERRMQGVPRVVTPPAEAAVGLEGAGAGAGAGSMGEVDFFQDFQDFFLQTNSLEFTDMPLEQWGF